MSDTYDWSRFYDELGKLGPRLLAGIDDETREVIGILASTTDDFWSDGLVDLLATGAAAGDLRSGVLAAVEQWRENVLEALSSNFGIELSFGTVTITTDSSLIDELVDAATRGDTDGAGPD